MKHLLIIFIAFLSINISTTYAQVSRAQCEDLLAQLSQLTQQQGAKSTECTDLQAQLDQLKNDRKQVKAELAGMNTRLGEIKSAIGINNSIIATNSAKFKGLSPKGTLTKYNKKALAGKQYVGSGGNVFVFTNGNDFLGAMKAYEAKNGSSVGEDFQAYNKAQKDNKALKAERKKVAADKKARQTELANINKQITDLETRLKACKDCLPPIVQQINQLKEQYKQCQDQLGQATIKAQQLQNKANNTAGRTSAAIRTAENNVNNAQNLVDGKRNADNEANQVNSASSGVDNAQRTANSARNERIKGEKALQEGRPDDAIKHFNQSIKLANQARNLANQNGQKAINAAGTASQKPNKECDEPGFVKEKCIVTYFVADKITRSPYMHPMGHTAEEYRKRGELGEDLLGNLQILSAMSVSATSATKSFGELLTAGGKITAKEFGVLAAKNLVKNKKAQYVGTKQLASLLGYGPSAMVRQLKGLLIEKRLPMMVTIEAAGWEYVVEEVTICENYQWVKEVRPISKKRKTVSKAYKLLSVAEINAVKLEERSEKLEQKVTDRLNQFMREEMHQLKQTSKSCK